MPLSKTLSEESNYVIGKLSGVVVAEELIDLLFWIIQQYEVGLLKNDYRVLINLTGIDDVQMNETDIRRISHVNMTYARDRGQIKTGIVVNDKAGKRLAGLHIILSKSADIEVEVFDTLHPACSWLQITPPPEPME